MPEIPFKTVAGFVTIVVVIGCILLLSEPGFNLESSLYFNEDVDEPLPLAETPSEKQKEKEKQKCPPEVKQPPSAKRDGENLDPALQNAVYRNLRPFLLATPQIVTRTEPPLYLTDVKNPCFAMDKGYMNVGNINITTAVRLKLEIRCLPYVYLAGFSKCGTTDFHAKMVQHQLLYGIATTRKLDRFSTHVWDENYRNIKETHFWDNRHCIWNRTLDSFTQLMSAEAIIKAYHKFGTEQPYNPKKQNDYRQMLYIESTPRQAFHHDSWTEELVHYGRREPYEFTPDRIHHSTPQAKVIFLVRDPVARTFSDYRYLTAKKSYHSAEDFHRRVVEAISWWRNCTDIYSERVCAYGTAPPGLPMHTSPSCSFNKFIKVVPPCDDYKSWGCGVAIDRFRISLYYIYLAEWLRVFPSDNVLILKSEEMFSDRMGVLAQIYDFLGMPPLRPEIYEALAAVEKNTKKSKQFITMLNATQRLLEEFFEPANRKLADMMHLEEPFWSWNTTYN